MRAGSANYLREERQRRQIQGAFGQYLSPALVDRLTDNPHQLVLGGETRELTVLFTDIRGFTTLSESYRDNPQGLTRLMNEFLTELSQPILDHNGTIDKYMGDAIMAFWNAPVEETDHAYKACIAALAMIDTVEALNERRFADPENTPEPSALRINVGIGINSGPCVVGNMGSRNRFDYTALGDTVNLASRLEGQSKPYGLPVVVGESTVHSVAGRLATFEVDLIRVKGKNEPAHIYCLAGNEDLMATEDFESFCTLNDNMIKAYRNREWTEAISLLDRLEPIGKRLNLPLSDFILIYRDRIRQFRKHPPDANWDGVYTASSK